MTAFNGGQHAARGRNEPLPCRRPIAETRGLREQMVRLVRRAATVGDDGEIEVRQGILRIQAAIRPIETDDEAADRRNKP